MTVGRQTVLILEDEVLIAMTMEDSVRDLGFAPIVSASIDDALNVIEAGQVDLAILDFQIRDRDSEPVALALRRRSIPFLVCSGTVMKKLTDAFDGAPYVGKPYTDNQLQAAIFAALA